MRDFSGFIEESNLIDVRCKGKIFSWFSWDRKDMSRIDRFLLSDSLITMWGIVGQLIGKRDVSDYYPIWIIINCFNWGPKPFNVKNSWFDNKEFCLLWWGNGGRCELWVEVIFFLKRSWDSLRIFLECGIITYLGGSILRYKKEIIKLMKRIFCSLVVGTPKCRMW